MTIEPSPGTAIQPEAREARAYCGPAHGQEWTVSAGEPAAWVELPTGASSCLYRLVRDGRTRRPARDHLGFLLYVPISDTGRPPATSATARVLPFPPGGRRGAD